MTALKAHQRKSESSNDDALTKFVKAKLQVYGDLPLPLHERSAAPGSHLHHLQVRVCCWLPEAQGQEMPVSLWLPRNWNAHQGDVSVSFYLKI